MYQTHVRPVSKSTLATSIAGAAASLLVFGIGTAAAAGGTVTGKISFKGAPPPAPAAVKVAANPEKCGTEQLPEVLIAPDGAVRWAVVRIVEAKGAWPAAAESPALDQRGCKFAPHVVVVPAGKPLKVLNSDGILHNVHTFPQKNAALNIAQPGFKKTMDATFAQPETVKVGCDVHAWMSALRRRGGHAVRGSHRRDRGVHDPGCAAWLVHRVDLARVARRADREGHGCGRAEGHRVGRDGGEVTGRSPIAGFVIRSSFADCGQLEAAGIRER